MEEKEAGRGKSRKKLIIISACVIAALILCAVMISILEAVGGEGSDEHETLPPVDILKLHETYGDDFDIMEYEEYLGYDRSIYLDDPRYGLKQSVLPEHVSTHGRAFEVVYNVMIAINEGDCDTYNSLMGSKGLKKGEFTQQQIYDIVIMPYSSSESGAVEEHIFKVTYKIHENNGTYRNTIESDASRPQYFYVDNSTGEFKVMKIIEQGYKW